VRGCRNDAYLSRRKECLVVVLTLLVIMLVGSLVSLFVIPPFLAKIEPTGRVNFFGIKFL
jgi:hypothetical protein